MIKLLRTDPEMNDFLFTTAIATTRECMSKATERSTWTRDRVKSTHGGQQSTEKMSARYHYINTELDIPKTTLREAIRNSNYAEDECWMNTVYDFYGGSLLSIGKKRKQDRQGDDSTDHS